MEKLADGVYEAESFIDDDGVKRDEPVPIHVKVTIDRGSMTIDLSGCSGERKAAINSRTYAGARVAYKALTGPLDPVNEGSFRALKVIIPEGNIMMARFPAPMSGWSAIVPTVVDTIVKALADAMPDRVPAGHHGLLGGAVVFFGVHPKTQPPLRGAEHRRRRLGRPADPRTANPARCRSARATCATARSKASSSNARCWSRAGGCAPIPAAPASIAAAWASTCGCAIWSRAAGISSIPGARNARPGACGAASPASYGDFLLRLPGENDFRSMAGSHYPVPVESEVIVRTGGGGGWGDPLERDAALVRSDVIEELVSRRVAEQHYGVVLQGRFDA